MVYLPCHTVRLLTPYCRGFDDIQVGITTSWNRYISMESPRFQLVGIGLPEKRSSTTGEALQN